MVKAWWTGGLLLSWWMLILVMLSFPAGLHSHPALASAKHFVLGQQWWNLQQIQWYCMSIFRCMSWGPQRMGGLWYFAASPRPCCQGADLISHSPSVMDCRTSSGLLQNRLGLSPSTPSLLNCKYTCVCLDENGFWPKALLQCISLRAAKNRTKGSISQIPAGPCFWWAIK